jgi:hypothetical protein
MQSGEPSATERAVASLEAAITREAYEEARAHLRTLRRLEPAHPRLTFFDVVIKRGEKGRETPTAESRP